MKKHEWRLQQIKGKRFSHHEPSEKSLLSVGQTAQGSHKDNSIKTCEFLPALSS